MTPQVNDDIRRRRPSRWRWLPSLALGLLLFVYVLLDLLPRFVGGLLGRDEDRPGGWSGIEGESMEIVWDPGEERDEEQQEDPEESPEETPPPDAEDLLAEDLGEESEAAPAKPVDRGGERPAPGEPEPAPKPSTGSPGSGPERGEGRRSPRILSQAWVRQDLLAELDRSGSYRFRLRVEADGRVSRWELLSGFDCEPCLAEAERIIRSLRFAPGTLKGKAVACWVPYQIEFQGGRDR